MCADPFRQIETVAAVRLDIRNNNVRENNVRKDNIDRDSGVREIAAGFSAICRLDDPVTALSQIFRERTPD
jgi:hypothetical protein